MSDLFAMMQAAAGAAGEEQYEISRSLRFNSADSAYLSRTPGTAGNQKTFTFSVWFKRGTLGAVGNFLTAGTASPNPRTELRFETDNTLTIGWNIASNTWTYLKTTQVFRDPSAWYHLVIAADTTQATAANRVKVYINGVQITAFGTEQYPSQNDDLIINSTDAHSLGRYESAGSAYFDGLMADVYLIDGQALTPSDFGETDVTTGVWKPKAYAGTYGTNGFYLPFSDNTSTTTLGYDEAGSNDWTLNNFSVASGAGNDSVVDTPTPYGDDTGAGGEVRGNYCVLNPLQPGAGTITNGGLTVVTAVSGGFGGVGTMAVPSSGKWYWEGTPTNNGSDSFIGIYRILNSTYAAYYGFSGEKYISGTNSAYGATFTNNDVIGVAVDVDAGEITFYKNGSSQGAFSFDTSSGEYVPYFNDGTGARATTYNVNFGQQPFVHAAPSGFKALCTQNLPTPTIADGSEYFNTILWTGDDTSPRSFTGVGFQPDLVWFKDRDRVLNHQIYDAVRGTGLRLSSNTQDAETTDPVTGYISSFDSDGFTATAGTSSNSTPNLSGSPQVAWNWNAGGSNATNTDGSITSTVRANPTAGFSIVTFDQTSSPQTIGHGLGVAPKMVIVKDRDTGVTDWQVYHASLGATNKVLLNLTNASAASTVFNNTAPTSTVFSFNSTSGLTVAYCFAEVEGYSKFGSYTGNGSTDGPFVYCGFRPAFVMAKRTDSADGWYMLDTTRDVYNGLDSALSASSDGAEFSTAVRLDSLSNGFKLRTTAGPNQSGGTYIFMAFAENPFKYSLAR